MPLAALLGLLPSLFNLASSKWGVDPEVIQDPIKAAELRIEALRLISNQSMAQLEVDKEEAQHPIWGWPSWRQLIGYTCAFAFMYHYLIQQIICFIFNACGHPVTLPDLATSELMTILMGMLGLGGLDAGQHYINSVYNSPPGLQPGQMAPNDQTIMQNQGDI